MWVLAMLLYVPYLVMAWYDYIYVCKRKLGPTYLSMFYMWAKPHEDTQYVGYASWCPEIRNRVILVDLLVLVGLGLLARYPIKAFGNFQPFKQLFALFAGAAVLGAVSESVYDSSPSLSSTSTSSYSASGSGDLASC